MSSFSFRRRFGGDWGFRPTFRGGDKRGFGGAKSSEFAGSRKWRSEIFSVPSPQKIWGFLDQDLRGRQHWHERAPASARVSYHAPPSCPFTCFLCCVCGDSCDSFGVYTSSIGIMTFTCRIVDLWDFFFSFLCLFFSPWLGFALLLGEGLLTCAWWTVTLNGATI